MDPTLAAERIPPARVDQIVDYLSLSALLDAARTTALSVSHMCLTSTWSAIGQPAIRLRNARTAQTRCREARSALSGLGTRHVARLPDVQAAVARFGGVVGDAQALAVRLARDETRGRVDELWYLDQILVLDGRRGSAVRRLEAEIAAARARARQAIAP